MWSIHKDLKQETGFTQAAFREFVVGPQIILSFVQEDLQLSPDQAYQKMWKTTLYGVEMFDKDDRHENRCAAMGAQLMQLIDAANLVRLPRVLVHGRISLNV